MEDGVQDLQLAAARGVYPSPDGFTFVTSGMLRANQTLRAIYGDVPFSVIGDLREVNFGIFEMKSYEDLKTEPVYQDWLAGDWFRNVPPRGESFADSKARLLRGLDELLSRKDNTIWRLPWRDDSHRDGKLIPGRGKRRLRMAAETRLWIRNRSGKSRISSNFGLISLQDFKFCAMMLSHRSSMFLRPIFRARF